MLMEKLKISSLMLDLFINRGVSILGTKLLMP